MKGTPIENMHQHLLTSALKLFLDPSQIGTPADSAIVQLYFPKIPPMYQTIFNTKAEPNTENIQLMSSEVEERNG